MTAKKDADDDATSHRRFSDEELDYAVERIRNKFHAADKAEIAGIVKTEFYADFGRWSIAKILWIFWAVLAPPITYFIGNGHIKIMGLLP